MSASMTQTKTSKGGHSCPPNVGLENPPSGWEISPIGDLVTLRTKQRNPERDPEKRFFYVDVSSVSNTSFRITAPTELPGAEAPSRARKVIQAGDVLFATVRPTLKRVALVPDDLHDQIASTGFIVLRSDALRLDSRYLYYRLLTDAFTQRMSELERGASYPAVRDSDILNEKIALPPLPEQRKIAGVLGLVQRAMEQQERLIALVTELKKALLHKLFTEGLRGESQKQTEIGPVPESWEQRPLEKAGEVVYGIQAAVASNLKPVGTMILTNKNITLDGKIILEKINYFELKTKRHHETVLQKGDLLFNWRSGSKEHVGKTAYFDLAGEFVHSSFILRIRPSDEVTGRYLFYYLNFLRESGFFLKKQTFSVNAKFNKSAINELPTYLPGEEERREVVDALDAVGKKLDTLHSKKRLIEDLFRTLLHQLMTAQIRVKRLDIEELKAGIS